MDFKKAVPMEFVEYVRDAQKSVESGSSSFEHLRMDPVALTVIQVVSHIRHGFKKKKKKIFRVIQLVLVKFM